METKLYEKHVVLTPHSVGKGWEEEEDLSIETIYTIEYDSNVANLY
jgi:hypothetical protein